MTVQTLLILSVLSVAGFVCEAQPDVRVEPPDPGGTRNLREITASAAVQSYLQSWQTFRSAFEQNNANLLQKDFVGTAMDKLTKTIQQQNALGIHASYQDKRHDLRVVFYSPEGLSLELIDNVEYDVHLLGNDGMQDAEHIRSKYVVVMTPAETRWKVRVFQAEPE